MLSQAGVCKIHIGITLTGSFKILTVLMNNSNPAAPKQWVVSIYWIVKKNFCLFNYLKIKYSS